jgi:hypothetical protein
LKILYDKTNDNIKQTLGDNLWYIKQYSSF